MTDRAWPRRVEPPKLDRKVAGGTSEDTEASMLNVTAIQNEPKPEGSNLIEAVVDRENMELALKKVEQNKGAAGIDGMKTEEGNPRYPDVPNSEKD